jgi:P2-related tail formation protein
MKRNEIEQLLPEIFRRTVRPGNPLYALLAAMEALHAPSEAVLAELDRYLDPYRAPDSFVPYLARWVDLQRFLAEFPEPEESEGGAGRPASVPFAGGLGRLRDLIATAASLSKWRGTAKGLLRFLETATGVHGFEIDEAVPGPDGKPRSFHLGIRAPAEAQRYQALVERIIEMEKPAYVTYTLTFEGSSA